MARWRHHRIGLGDCILGAIVMHRQSGDDDYALPRFDPQAQRALITTVFDAAGEGRAKVCWALIRRARADKFKSASAAANPSLFQRVASRRPEKPDRYWSAPRPRKAQ